MPCPVLEFAFDDRFDRGTGKSLNKTRPQHAGSGQRNDPLGPKPPGREEFPDGNNFLVAQMPNGAFRPDGIEVMNMRAGQTGGMRAIELDRIDPLCIGLGNRAALSAAEIDRT